MWGDELEPTWKNWKFNHRSPVHGCDIRSHHCKTYGGNHCFVGIYRGIIMLCCLWFPLVSSFFPINRTLVGWLFGELMWRSRSSHFNAGRGWVGAGQNEIRWHKRGQSHEWKKTFSRARAAEKQARLKKTHLPLLPFPIGLSGHRLSVLSFLLLSPLGKR